MNQGLQSPFWFSREEQRDEFEVIVFDHGLGCVCGSEFVIPKDHWERLGSPRELFVIALPYSSEPTIGEILGPVGMF